MSTTIHHPLIGSSQPFTHAGCTYDLTHDRHTLSPPPQDFQSNSFTGPCPTELGRLNQMTQGFRFFSNKLCSDVPTQVQALSSGVTSYWQVTTGNSFGTICGWQSDMADARFPTMDGSTGVTSIDHNQQGLTGTIPTEVSVRLCACVRTMSVCTYLLIHPLSRGTQQI